MLVLLASGHVLAVESLTPANAVDDRSLFHQALQLTEQGNWSEAASLFSAIAQRHPDWPEPKNNLAVAMLKMGKLEQAQQALEDAVSSQPSFRVAQHNRKRLYDHLAAIAYERALGKNEQNALPNLDLLTRISLVEPVSPAQKQAPVTAPAADRTGAVQASENIKQGLLTWSRAWSAADVEAYFAAYSTRFKPADAGKDYNQWRNIRRARLKLSRNTQVSLQDIRVYLDPDKQQAVAQFIQSYSSANYRDRVLKQLQLAWENNQWLILSERVIEQLD